MNRIITLMVLGVLCVTPAFTQTANFQGKSKTDLVAFIKENIETHANFMGIDYKVDYDPAEPNILRIGEKAGSDFKWYKIDLSKAAFGTSVSIAASNKDNFILSFRKDITTREKNNKNAGFDVMFFKKKDKRETDFAVLIENLTKALTNLIEQSKA